MAYKEKYNAINNEHIEAWGAGAAACIEAADKKVRFETVSKPFRDEFFDDIRDGAAAVVSTLDEKDAKVRSGNLKGFGDILARARNVAVSTAGRIYDLVKKGSGEGNFLSGLVSSLKLLAAENEKKAKRRWMKYSPRNDLLSMVAEETSRSSRGRRGLLALCLAACILMSPEIAHARPGGTETGNAHASYAASCLDAYDAKFGVDSFFSSGPSSVVEKAVFQSEETGEAKKTHASIVAEHAPSADRSQAQDGNCAFFALADAMESAWGASLSTDDVEKLARVLMPSSEAGGSLSSTVRKLSAKTGLELPVEIFERGVTGTNPVNKNMLEDTVRNGGKAVLAVVGWSAFEDMPVSPDGVFLKGFAENETYKNRLERSRSGAGIGHAVTVVGETDDAFVIVNPFRDWGTDGVGLVDKDALAAASVGAILLGEGTPGLGESLSKEIQSMDDEGVFFWNVRGALLETETALKVLDNADIGTSEGRNDVLSALAAAHAQVVSEHASFVKILSCSMDSDDGLLEEFESKRKGLESGMLGLYQAFTSGKDDAEKIFGEVRQSLSEYGNFLSESGERIAENGWTDAGALRAMMITLGASFDADGELLDERTFDVGAGSLFHAASFLGMVSPDISENEESGLEEIQSIVESAFGNGQRLDDDGRTRILELASRKALPLAAEYAGGGMEFGI